MDENLTTHQESSTPAKVCINCGNPDIVKNVPNALCIDCRTAAIKFPIPVWVKGFGIGILLLVIFSLLNLPQNITIGVNLERGIKAEEENKYTTAEYYFKQAVHLDSFNIEANAHLFIAAYYNNDMENFMEAGSKLSSQTLDDDELLNRVNILLNKADYYFPSDSFLEIEKEYASADNIPDTTYTNYIQKNSDNLFEETLYASSLFDHKNYHACDSLIHDILNTDDENMSALGLMGSAKRFENQPDSAVYYCDRMLRLNNEYIYARCLKARALLKMKKNDEALQLALDCKKTDSTDAYTLATLALVYHFSNQPQERDAIIKHAMAISDSSAIPVLQYVTDVINNKESL